MYPFRWANVPLGVRVPHFGNPWIRKISLAFGFVTASRKKSFHISVMSHNAEIKLCNIYQFAKAFSGIASYKIFCSAFMFHHFTINYIWLILYLNELTQVLVLVKQFSFVNRNVSFKQILLLRSEIPSGMCAKLRTVAQQ